MMKMFFRTLRLVLMPFMLLWANTGDALLQGGGKIQTSCLRITDAQGQVQWMYEPDDIIKYLRQRFA